MGIRRSALSFDERFTQVPNDWARDVRLSRRARGLLLEIMSHRVGWHVSIRSLAKTGKEGRDAIQSALGELLEHGYVRRSQGRAAQGTFGEIEYELCEPAVAGFPVHGSAASGSAVSGSAVSGESDHKEDHSSEDHPEELLLTPPGASVTVGELFDRFWAVYPRKAGKDLARRTFEGVVKKADAEVVIEGARRFAADPNLPEKRFIPHPSTWLSRGSWDDEPLPPRMMAAAAPVVVREEQFAPGDEWLAFNR